MTKKWFIYSIAALAMVCSLTACSQGPATKTDSTQTKQVVKPVVKKYYYNDVALYLAGMMPDTSGVFNKLVKKSQWKLYSNSFDTMWKGVEKNSLAKVRKWTDTALAEVHKSTKTLFYPFSGPDFLYANTIFPEANKYILFGLERTGSIPNVAAMTDQRMNSLFVSINKSLTEILKLSFFITKEMNSNLNTQDVDGVLPVIMLFMARTGNTVQNIKNAKIGPDGKIIVADTFITYKGGGWNRGVEITFSPAGKDTVTKKLYYFPVDFTDSALNVNPSCQKFLQAVDTNCTTLVKSASYLMHYPIFSYIRNIVLKKSKFELQDDSGISYKFFDKTKWNIQLFGTYERPIPVFSYAYQADLKAAFDKGAKPYNFKYGYGNGRNIMLSTRIK